VTLQLSGFEESVASLGLHGKDSGLTFNVMASPSNGSAGNQKGQEKILVYSKTLTVADIMSKPYAYKAGSEEPLALPLPEGSSNVEVEVVGSQSGIKSSETMVVDSADTNPTTHKLMSLQFDPSGGILAGLRLSPRMEEQASAVSSQKMKCCKRLKRLVRRVVRVVSIVATVTIAAVVGVIVAGATGNPVAGVMAGVSVFISGARQCGESWKRGQFCVYGKHTQNIKPEALI
jgi:hypothetical protein